MTWCVYDKDHMNALQIKNTSENDSRKCEDVRAMKQGFLAQLVEHDTPVLRRSWVWISLEPQNFFWALFVTTCKYDNIEYRLGQLGYT